MVPSSYFSILFLMDSPDQTLKDQKISSGETIRYQISNILRNSRYEVRVSYPATQPLVFETRLVFGETFRSRDILNVEKISFETNSDGFVV